MKIELKNIKYSEFASEETCCFEATVYVDGKREFVASNSGQGGENKYHALKQTKSGGQMNVWNRVKEIDAVLGEEKEPEYGMDNCLEFAIGDLINKFLLEKEIKKMLKKLTVIDSDGNIGSYKVSNADFARNQVAYTKRMVSRNEIILNGKPIEEVLTLLREKSNYFNRDDS